MTLRILRAANDEAEEAGDWYEGKQSGLGDDFLKQLEIVYDNIEKHPHRPRRIHLADFPERELHQAILRRFPYKVIYEVTDKAVVVLAVAHGRRKPNYWKDRV